jgi:hypothetical protein
VCHGGQGGCVGCCELLEIHDSIDLQWIPPGLHGKLLHGSISLVCMEIDFHGSISSAQPRPQRNRQQPHRTAPHRTGMAGQVAAAASQRMIAVKAEPERLSPRLSPAAQAAAPFDQAQIAVEAGRRLILNGPAAKPRVTCGCWEPHHLDAVPFEALMCFEAVPVKHEAGPAPGAVLTAGAGKVARPSAAALSFDRFAIQNGSSWRAGMFKPGYLDAIYKKRKNRKKKKKELLVKREMGLKKREALARAVAEAPAAPRRAAAVAAEGQKPALPPGWHADFAFGRRASDFQLDTESLDWRLIEKGRASSGRQQGATESGRAEEHDLTAFYYHEDICVAQWERPVAHPSLGAAARSLGRPEQLAAYDAMRAAVAEANPGPRKSALDNAQLAYLDDVLRRQHGGALTLTQLWAALVRPGSIRCAAVDRECVTYSNCRAWYVRQADRVVSYRTGNFPALRPAPGVAGALPGSLPPPTVCQPIFWSTAGAAAPDCVVVRVVTAADRATAGRAAAVHL